MNILSGTMESASIPRYTEKLFRMFQRLHDPENFPDTA